MNNTTFFYALFLLFGPATRKKWSSVVLLNSFLLADRLVYYSLLTAPIFSLDLLLPFSFTYFAKQDRNVRGRTEQSKMVRPLETMLRPSKTGKILVT